MGKEVGVSGSVRKGSGEVGEREEGKGIGRVGKEMRMRVVGSVGKGYGEFLGKGEKGKGGEGVHWRPVVLGKGVIEGLGERE